tara:strand:- start:2240 stop:3118 length:879 start_codon:yes stop_codon:yes gene_type:complete
VKQSFSLRFLSLISLVVTSIFFATLWASVSHAHDPLFLLPDQEAPTQGPLLPDGTISFALYGEFLTEGETRGFQANFEDGDLFQLELLIPALNPEQSLQQDQLPFLRLTTPDGSEQTLYPSIRTRFDEPFTNTSYFTLIQERGTAEDGVYDIVIVSRAPARFTTAIGIKEQFGTPVQRAGERPSSFTETSDRLGEWYDNSSPDPLQESNDDHSSSPIAETLDASAAEISAEELGAPSENLESRPVTPEQDVEDLETGDEPSTNQTLWLLVIIAIVAIPVAIAIRRILRSTPK